jgi:uncharacterized membrane protein YoaK (UPF0700 family)
MSSLSSEKRKRKNRTRFIILLLIYLMVVGMASGVVYGNGVGINTTGGIIALIIIAVCTIIYWVAFYIVCRRDNQRESD